MGRNRCETRLIVEEDDIGNRVQDTKIFTMEGINISGPIVKYGIVRVPNGMGADSWRPLRWLAVPLSIDSYIPDDLL